MIGWRVVTAVTIALCLGATGRAAQANAPAAPSCAACAEWNQPQQPLRIFGNTYYVGVHGLGSILITSPAGDVLIDGALPESAPAIEAHVRALGVALHDIKLIVNSHVHFDHAGGIARLQALSGATVAALPRSATVLERGSVGRDDPQFGSVPSIAPVRRVRIIRDGETLRLGSIAVTAHATPGHTPGGTTWTWRSCEGERCLDLVYADSLTPVSSDDFLFTRNRTYPNVIADFEKSFAVVAALPCDILLTPHPDASALWQRLARREAEGTAALVDRRACGAYAAAARDRLAARVRAEQSR